LLGSAKNNLKIDKAYDPQATDLHAVGRALLLTTNNPAALDIDRLAALAHRAGFAYVCHRFEAVYVSVAPDDYFEIRSNGSAATAADGVDLFVGETVTLTLNPQPSGGVLYQWRTISCGAGQAKFVLNENNRPSELTNEAGLELTAPGQLVIKVDIARRGHTVSATRTFRIGVNELNDNQWIWADGRPGQNDQVALAPGESVDPTYLIDHNNPQVDYGSEPDNHRLQAGTARSLDRLLDLLKQGGISGQLVVAQAYTPGSADLYGVGRALTLSHGKLDVGRLGALAYGAEFSYVGRQEANILVRQAQDDLLTIISDQAIVNGRTEVAKGDTVRLALKPQPPSSSEGISWVLRQEGSAQAQLSSTTLPKVQLYAQRAGQVQLRALLVRGQNTAPYAFEVRLKPDLEADPNVIIAKDQYDRIMNVLSALHPIGVEVITRAIRERVLEIRETLLDAIPDYTYPKFKGRGPQPGPPKQNGGNNGYQTHNPNRRYIGVARPAGGVRNYNPRPDAHAERRSPEHEVGAYCTEW
jgi:hypothetical protein